MTDDLELKDIDSYCGTMQYHNVLGFNVTDGIAYIINNGYSWFVTDTLAVIKTNATIRKEEFLSIKLKLKNKGAEVIITDGNDKELYKHHYSFTTAKRELTLFYQNKVLMLDGEY